VSEFDVDEKIRKARTLMAELDDVIDSISDCSDSLLDDDALKEIILRSIASHEWDIDWEGDSSFEGMEEKRKIYSSGVMRGYNSALFWLCDALNLVEFFEDHIGHNFENLKGLSDGSTKN
jgi:hypothetical protein